MNQSKCKCGTEQPEGCYSCCNCGQDVNLDSRSTLPPCPNCGNDTFTKVD